MSSIPLYKPQKKKKGLTKAICWQCLRIGYNYILLYIIITGGSHCLYGQEAAQRSRACHSFAPRLAYFRSWKVTITFYLLRTYNSLNHMDAYFFFITVNISFALQQRSREQFNRLQLQTRLLWVCSQTYKVSSPTNSRYFCDKAKTVLVSSNYFRRMK